MQPDYMIMITITVLVYKSFCNSVCVYKASCCCWPSRVTENVH